jgi:hypothetical protein
MGGSNNHAFTSSFTGENNHLHCIFHLLSWLIFDFPVNKVVYTLEQTIITCMCITYLEFSVKQVKLKNFAKGFN